MPWEDACSSVCLAPSVSVGAGGSQSQAGPHPSFLNSLISTDATARGIDVQGVQLVVNYDAPQYLRTYVHR